MKTALITGASSGIGLEFAKIFAREGYDLVIIATNAQKLGQVAFDLHEEYNVKIKVITKDLSEKNSAKEIFDELEKEKIEIDVLINNAGFALYGEFSQTNLEIETQMIETNILALTQLTKFALKNMLKKKEGKILNVASTAAFQPGPLMSVYYATKAYVLFFTEAIANELKGSGISVTALCPGPTETGFQKRSMQEESKLVKGKKLMSAKEVAEIGYDALMKGKIVVVPGLDNYLKSLGPRFLPRDFTAQYVRNLQEKKRN